MDRLVQKVWHVWLFGSQQSHEPNPSKGLVGSYPHSIHLLLSHLVPLGSFTNPSSRLSRAPRAYPNSRIPRFLGLAQLSLPDTRIQRLNDDQVIEQRPLFLGVIGDPDQ